MSASPNPSSHEFFEQMYRNNADPWDFASDSYESSRYDAIIAALAGRRFARAFEPGCSVGVLTERLAPLCDDLLAVDLSESAVTRARLRCTAYPHVRIKPGSVDDTEPGSLDLLLLSEIGYYFTAQDLEGWGDRLISRVRFRGTLLSCHWLGTSPDHLLSGDEVHEILQHLAEKHCFTLVLEQRTEKYRLALWDRK